MKKIMMILSGIIILALGAIGIHRLTKKTDEG